MPPISSRLILLAGAAFGLPGCLLAPSRFVAGRTAAPAEVARATASAPPLAEPRPAPSPPESSPPAAPRSLGDLVDLALSRDPSTRATWHDARVAAAQAGARRNLFLPSIEASAPITRQRSGSTGGRQAFDQTTYGASATIAWVLLDAGGRSALVEEADRLLAAARLAEHAAVADLVLRVQETYFLYLGARALEEAQGAAVRQAETSLAAAEARRRAGVATVADVLQARTALSQSRLALQQFEGQALALRGALATLAGLTPAADLDVGALPIAVEPSAAEAAVEELLAAAAARSPDVARARAAADAARARAKAAGRAGWPVLSLQGSASRTLYLRPEDTDPATAWSVGLSLRLPLFEGLRPAYDAIAARAAADAASARAEATEQRVALDVWSGFQSLRTAGRRVVSARDLVQSATAAAEVTSGRYREGVGTLVDLLNSQAALELARAEDVRARADWFLSLARLQRATGRIELTRTPGAPEGPSKP